MAKKYDLITDLYAQSIREVTAKPENWLSFLRSACRNFRLPFDEQILVHVQRPEASAVLTMEDWNQKFGRWVKQNSHAIAVFDKSGNYVKLKYYFDVSDTKEGRYKRLVRPVPLWKVTEENEQAVKETLSNAFRVPEDRTELPEIILSAAEHLAEDNLLDYMQDILAYRNDSFIEELDDYNVEVMVRNLLSKSVAYMLMVRCGIDTEEYLELEDFREIREFNTSELVNLFGTAASDVSEMALTEISDTMKKLQQEKYRRNHTFAGQDKDRYTEQERTQRTISERGLENERNDIQQTGRIYDTGSDRTRRAGSTRWEVWLPPQDISEREPLRTVYQSDDAGKIEPAPEGNTGRSTEQDRADYNGDESSTERDGGTESQRSDEMGGNDGKYPSVSGGDRAEGTDLRLGGQLAFLDDLAEEKTSAFSFSQEVIDYVIREGKGFLYEKHRIYSYFLQGHTTKEKADFLKEEYGTGGHTPILAGVDIGENHNAKGLELYRAYRDDGEKILLSWTQVVKRIEELIAANRYMTQKELDFIPEYEKHMLARDIYLFYTHLPITVVRPYPPAAYENAVKEIRSQLDNPERVEELLSGMAEVLDNTADFDRHYTSMQTAYQNLQDYRDGVYSLFSPIPAEKEESILPDSEGVIDEEVVNTEEVDIERLAERLRSFYETFDLYGYRDNMEAGESDEDVQKKIYEQLLNPEQAEGFYDSLIGIVEEMASDDEQYEELQRLIKDVADLQSMNPPYDLHTDTIVSIGMDTYEILSLSDETAVLRNQMYPLFTEEMPREVFEQRVRENPANDHLKIKQEIPRAEQAEIEQNKTSLQAEDTQSGLAHQNYLALMELAPKVLQRELESMEFQAGKHFLPLTVEWVGDSWIAMSHYFEENGDSFPDPDMEFEVDHEKQELRARTYDSAYDTHFQDVTKEGGIIDEELERELDEFAHQWFPPMQIKGIVYDEKQEAGKAIIAACKEMESPDPEIIGVYRGLTMELYYNTFGQEFAINLKGKMKHQVTLGTDIHGNITRLDNAIAKFEDNLLSCKERLETMKIQLETARQEIEKPFPQEEELKEKVARLGELNAMLDMDKKEHTMLDAEPDEELEEPEKGSRAVMER